MLHPDAPFSQEDPVAFDHGSEILKLSVTEKGLAGIEMPCLPFSESTDVVPRT